jgi:hypothetical protein
MVELRYEPNSNELKLNLLEGVIFSIISVQIRSRALFKFNKEDTLGHWWNRISGYRPASYFFEPGNPSILRI